MGLVESIGDLLEGYDPYSGRPAEFTHRCHLPKRRELAARWICPRCDCPWIMRKGLRQWTSVHQADSRPPHETTLVGETKSAVTRPRWYFDNDRYREGSSN